MNQTENLHLPQWEADDRIMRTDFNAAMQSIDAGVKAANDAIAAKADAADLTAEIAARQAALPIVKLKDVTLAADTAQWNIDVSDIDPTQYAFIYMIPGILASNNPLLRYDGKSGSNDYRSNNGTRDNAGSIMSNGCGFIRIQYFDNRIYTNINMTSIGGINSESFSTSSYAPATHAGFQQMNIVGALTAGSTMSLYGVKR